MSIQNICRCLFTAVFSAAMVFVASPVFAQADEATADTITEHKVKKTDSAGHQLCIGIDLVSPVRNTFYSDRHSYEGLIDYYLRNEFFLAFEGGAGGSKVDYPDLKYTTTNTFLRAGFNKTILARVSKTDWDMMFFGLRAAYTQINRSDASFTIVDSMWGNTQGTRPGKHFGAVWAELTIGMRVEFLKGVFAGWNLRGKFLMNGKSFKSDAPLYIAGYGKGDKNSAFDFNVYLSYGFRWARKYKVVTTSK